MRNRGCVYFGAVLKLSNPIVDLVKISDHAETLNHKTSELKKVSRSTAYLGAELKLISDTMMPLLRQLKFGQISGFGIGLQILVEIVGMDL